MVFQPRALMAPSGCFVRLLPWIWTGYVRMSSRPICRLKTGPRLSFPYLNLTHPLDV